MSEVKKLRDAFKEIANFDMSFKAYQDQLNKRNTILEVTNCYKAIEIARKALKDVPSDMSRAELGMGILDDILSHDLPDSQKLKLVVQVMDDYFDRTKDYSKQKELGL